jgi:NitT/TauT family transport system substrate-binding protein
MTRLEQDGSIKLMADTRTLKGTQEVWGAPLPAGVLHAAIEFVQKNPNTVQALANAIVRADMWIAKASATDVARVVPEAYLLGDRALYLFSFNKVKEAISPDGVISDAGAKATVKSLSEFDPNIKPAGIDLSKTYTNQFVKKANAKYK